MNSLVVKILTVLVISISDSQLFFAEKNLSSYFFGKNISVYAIFNDLSFNDTLTNFEPLGPGF